MKKLSAVLLLMLILGTISAGCGENGLFAPTATNTSTPTPEDTATPLTTKTPMPTDTPVPTVTSTPLPTPTEFPISLLPGYFAFMSYYDCPELSLTCIGAARADGSDYQILTTHTYGMAMTPVWSPDGRYIAYDFFALGGTGIYELRVFDFTKGVEFTLSPNLADSNVKVHSWSPDSANLVLSVTSGQTTDIDLYTINVQSKRMVNISNDPETNDDDPAWSPNGDLIAFSSNRDGSEDIWTISPQGSGAVNLTGSKEDAWSDRLPSWSPDGSRIAFFRFGEESNELWIMSADGVNSRMLFDLGSSVADEPTVWSYDGEWIAIIFGNNDREDIWLIDPYYGQAVQLNEQKGDFSLPSWSPDSVALVYNQDLSSGNSQLNLEVVGVEWPFHLDSETSIENVVWSPVDKLP